jgi:hypothetical protein
MATFPIHRASSRVSLGLFAASWLGINLLSWQACGQGVSVASVNPVAGSSVTNLTQVTVVFIKPVLDVHADDLILNGSSGINVVGSGAVYTFTFSPPDAGIVQASWNGAHNITDVLGNRLVTLAQIQHGTTR